ncbi:testis-expressed protein 26-like isoform X2 [Xiphias gladius]|uniref:testis-expressed protein 26-like isoform X2 n=1 Tax=Xiphias gladius TaxID=8245 RepID=UPI001A9A2747|nr:testis-expressed protein 26-like isoform X2 [Xiphias gladius]
MATKGTASGQRTNNLHSTPVRSFMMWRLPKDTTRRPEYVRFPWKCPPSEEEIRKALTAQYRSTYRCDFMGMPQGRRLAPLHSRHHEPLSTNTETRDNYRQPKQKPELMGNHTRHSCNTDPNVACHGIGTISSKTIDNACKHGSNDFY